MRDIEFSHSMAGTKQKTIPELLEDLHHRKATSASRLRDASAFIRLMTSRAINIWTMLAGIRSLPPVHSSSRQRRVRRVLTSSCGPFPNFLSDYPPQQSRCRHSLLRGTRSCQDFDQPNDYPGKTVNVVLELQNALVLIRARLYSLEQLH